MKRTTIAFLSLALLSVFFFTGCKKGCTNPLAENYDADAKKDDGSCEFASSGTLSLMLHHKAGTEDFVMGETYTLADGRSYLFTEAVMYLSGIGAAPEDGGAEETIDDSYLLVKPETMIYEVGDLVEGHYSELSLNVGLDEIANHSDPSSYALGHPLANQTPNMNWNWNSGYMFILIEGKMDTTAAMNGAVTDGNFSIHVGTDDLLRHAHIEHHFDMEEGGSTFHANLDWAELLNGVDLRTENQTNTFSDLNLATKVANNAPNIFSHD